jgi:hypothetical protein
MNEWICSYDGMILTGENWSTGKGTLYISCSESLLHPPWHNSINLKKEVVFFSKMLRSIYNHMSCENSANSVAFHLCKQEVWVQILAGPPTILTMVYHGCSVPTSYKQWDVWVSMPVTAQDGSDINLKYSNMHSHGPVGHTSAEGFNTPQIP